MAYISVLNHNLNYFNLEVIVAYKLWMTTNLGGCILIFYF